MERTEKGGAYFDEPNRGVERKRQEIVTQQLHLSAGGGATSTAGATASAMTKRTQYRGRTTHRKGGGPGGVLALNSATPTPNYPTSNKYPGSTCFVIAFIVAIFVGTFVMMKTFQHAWHSAFRNSTNGQSAGVSSDDKLNRIQHNRTTTTKSMVMLLLRNNADVLIINCEGKTPRDVTREAYIKELLTAAEFADAKRKEEELFEAAKEDDVETIQAVLRGSAPPNVNAIDTYGNTALHCASYRDRKEAAIFLLQCGINPNIQNVRGQTAADLARSDDMRRVLSVQPIKELKRTATRYEGPLLRRKRFLGMQATWVVLERGVISFFKTRADASIGAKRKRFHYLDGAQVVCDSTDDNTFTILLSDNVTERLVVPKLNSHKVDRTKWVNVINEHIEFSTYYIRQGMSRSDSDDDSDNDQLLLPIGNIQDQLMTSQAHYQLLENCVAQTAKLHTRFLETVQTSGAGDLKSVCSSQDLMAQLREVTMVCETVVKSLQSCLVLMKQQEETRTMMLKHEQEKCRVLQESLSALAREHHDLEVTVSGAHPFEGEGENGEGNATGGVVLPGGDRRLIQPPSPTSTEFDEFFDAFDEASPPLLSVSETSQSFATAAPSMSGSLETLHGDERTHWGRSRLPVVMFSKNDFSLWTILKQCLGKELSKITMPIVFNEPLSFLQRFSETMEYTYLLKRADDCQDPVERIELVATYAIAAVSSNLGRLNKPFNPLLGETYEMEGTHPEFTNTPGAKNGRNLDFRIISEQVSHHPPVSAFRAESPQWTMEGSINPRMKFWGKSVEIKPDGNLRARLLTHNEEYVWTHVNCCVHNIIVGKLWFEQYGTLEVTCAKTDLVANLTFKQAGWFHKDLHRVEGYIYNKTTGVKLKSLFGKWPYFMYACEVADFEHHYNDIRLASPPNQPNQRTESPASAAHDREPSTNHSAPLKDKATPTREPPTNHSSDNGVSPTNNHNNDRGSPDSDVTPTEDGPNSPLSSESSDVHRTYSTYSFQIPNSRLLWAVEPGPSYASEYYNFTSFAMALNELRDEQRDKLPKTDGRFRPDIRLLEEGDLDRAAAEKNRLEEKQRETRRRMKKQNVTWKPLWFEYSKDPETGVEDWRWKGRDYWSRKHFEECPDLF